MGVLRSAMRTSGGSCRGSSFTDGERDQQMQRGTASQAIARCPDTAAERADRVGAPVQAYSVVGFRRLGGKAHLEYALEIGDGDADPVVDTLQVQLLPIGLGHDRGAQAQRTALLAGIA